MRHAVVLVPLVIAGGCSDSMIVGKIANSDPSVSITAPAEGFVAGEGQAITVTAAFEDAETPQSALVHAWLLDGATPGTGTEAVTDTGAMWDFAGGLSVGAHTVSVQVIDGNGASAVATLDLSVVANAPPTVTIRSPTDGASATGSATVVAGLADDQPVTALMVGWTVDGVAFGGCPSLGADTVTCDVPLPDGTPSVCVAATDSQGATADACVTLQTCVPTTWYADADGDGLGDPATTETSCTPDAGYVDNADDCDDSDATATDAGSSPSCPGLSCETLLAADPTLTDGSYWLDPDGDADNSNAFLGVCDMTRDDGGWTLVQVGKNDSSADLNIDGAVGVLDGTTPGTSAKLSRTVIAELARVGTSELKYGHDDFGWLYLFDLDADWIATGVGATGYGTAVSPYTSDIRYAGTGYSGSRFAWPAGGVPEVCPNVDGTEGECGLGLHYGTWHGVYPDGIYMNYSSIASGPQYNVHYELWVK